MPDTLNVLTLGNSFTDSLAAYFEPVARAGGVTVRFERANFGGCELERHWSYIAAEEANPVCRIYRGGGRKFRDILADAPWDVVTIQQASHQSWRPETFQPYGRRVFDYIRRHAPDAEVVVQQTWAYRADDPRLLPGGEWGFDGREMYRRLTENYRRLAAELGGLRVIPTGYAVERSREAEAAPFVPYTPEAFAALRWPDLPPQAGDVVGAMRWEKNGETGAWEIKRDLIHLNVRGQYLQACVWFGYLTGRPVADTAGFEPAELSRDDAAALRDVAQAALNDFDRN